jgi:hypothetical protein
MLTCTVHEAPDPPADRIDRAEQLAFVRDGFSWTAALFTPIWLMAHRLWWPLLAYVGAAGAIELVRQYELVDPVWPTLATLALGLLFGFEADTLRRWGLGRRGWVTVGSVTGRNAENCERRFFDMWLPTQPVLAPASTPGDAPTGRTSLADALSSVFSGARG